jgi:hypothetical protein
MGKCSNIEGRRSNKGFCCLEAIAYVGEKQIGWVCIECGRVYHDSLYYGIRKGVTEYLTGALDWEMVVGL